MMMMSIAVPGHRGASYHHDDDMGLPLDTIGI